MAHVHTTDVSVGHVDLTLQVEIDTDLDTGRPWLIADTGDGYTETTPTQLRAHVEKLREQLENAARLADQYEAIQGLNALAVEYGFEIEEWDSSTLDERLREDFIVWYTEVDARPRMVFPRGQDPVTRLDAARALVDSGEVA